MISGRVSGPKVWKLNRFKLRRRKLRIRNFYVAGDEVQDRIMVSVAGIVEVVAGVGVKVARTVSWAARWRLRSLWMWLSFVHLVVLGELEDGENANRFQDVFVGGARRMRGAEWRINLVPTRFVNSSWAFKHSEAHHG